MNNSKGISDALKIGLFTEKALVPESPWLSTERPATPVIVSNDVQSKQGTRLWTVRLRKGDSRAV
ncbi:hypothetical protein ABTL54_20785, partial [Acinetobacter baumannii]